MFLLGLVLAALAGLLHVYIFVLESFLWTTPRGRRTFGMSEQDARTTKALAFNQGFYNLFLAVITLIGVVLALIPGGLAVGTGLVFAGVGSMLAAALVLLLSAPDKRAAAVTQGILPLLALAVLMPAVVLF